MKCGSACVKSGKIFFVCRSGNTVKWLKQSYDSYGLLIFKRLNVNLGFCPEQTQSRILVRIQKKAYPVVYYGDPDQD